MSYTELEYGYQGLRKAARTPQFYVGGGDLGLCDPSETTLCPQDMDNGGHQVVVGVCAMAKKSQSKPMKEILTRLQEFEYIKVIVFSEDVILQKPVEEWPVCDCLISFHSKGFPLEKAVQYSQLHNPYVINNLDMQYDIQDRRKVYSTLESEGIEIPRYAVLDRDSPDPKHHELVESEDHVEVNGIIFNKPFVEKPVSAEDHNIYIYYPTSAGGGSQRLFRKIGSRSSVYSPESRVRKTGSFIYEDFMPTDGTDVKVYTVGPDYAHAEARKSPALDGKVERDRDGKEIRYPVILSNAEKLISRKVCLAFKQAVCGFDLLRANGKSFVCDVNGFSFVKNSNKYYDDCAKILGNMILRELAPTLHIPWSVPFQLDDPPIVPTTFGKMMELRCVVAVIRHGDRTPKQKMKVEVRHPKFFEIFEKYDGYKHGHVKLKRPKQLQEILDIARSLLAEIQQHEADPEIEEKQGKLEQLKSVLEMYGHFSGINRKVQMKYQPKGRPRGSSSDDVDRPTEPSLVLILKWGGELTPAGRIQAEELGRIFRCMYPGGQGRHFGGEYAGAQGLGLLRLHSTFRHDLKIYASDEGRVQMTAAAFAKGLLALEGELTPILVQMVKSANTNGLLDNDCDSSKYQNMCKARLHELMQIDREFTAEDKEKINPGYSISIAEALDFVKNPFKCCNHVHALIKSLMEIIKQKKEDGKTKDAVLYHGETWELMGRRWGKIEKDFYTKNKNFDISKIPDIYDCIKYDLQHNQHTLQFEQAEELYVNAKYLADIVIPQEYGLTVQEKLTIGQGICTPLLKKIRADLQRNIEESGEETVNRLNPRYSHGVSSPGRHVRTRLYFTSESHVHSLITVLRHGDLLDIKKDEQWRRAMEYISMVSELNYMSQVVVMLYEDPTKDPSSEERFHVELHFSPGVNCCVQKNLPPGPGFRPHSRNESVASKTTSSNTSATATPEESKSNCSLRIEEELEVLGEEEKPYEQTIQIHKTSPIMDDSSSPPTPDTGYYKNYKSSDPIPIGNSHTVCGHEAMHLAKRLNEELAQQSQSSRSYGSGRAISPDPEPRSKSYDNKSAQTKGKADKLQYQSLDAVNSQETKEIIYNSESPPCDTDLSITPTNPYTFASSSISCIPSSVSSSVSSSSSSVIDYSSFKPISSSHDQRPLSPISGSFDIDGHSECDSPLTIGSYRCFTKSPTNECPLNELHFETDTDNNNYNYNKSRPQSSTNELPLTELNLALFTSKCRDNFYNDESQVIEGTSTNELPLCDINLKDLLDQNSSKYKEQDNLSLEVNWESENSDTDSSRLNENRKRRGNDPDNVTNNNNNNLGKSKSIIINNDNDKNRRNNRRESWPQHRSYSDPNILNTEKLNIDGVKESLHPNESPLYPFSFYPSSSLSNDEADLTVQDLNDLSRNLLCSNLYARSPTNILSFFSSSPSRPKRSFSHPTPDVTEPIMSDADNGSAVTRRHRHSIAGQMSYFKMLGYGFGPIGFKKLTAGSTNSLFSTAVISGSSSAPNLRDMIPSTASASAIEGFGGVPPIRPLETLHNALSLKQLDTFLQHMTVFPLFRTPSSTPPKYPSTPSITPLSNTPSAIITNTTATNSNANNQPPLRLQSPSSSWSGPPSFVSSSGPSSPGLSDGGYINSKESSEMSSSIISGDGMNMGNISHIFPTTPGLDQELENVGILLESSTNDGIRFSDYFTTFQQQRSKGLEDITPVSECEFNTTDATAGSTGECETITEDMDSAFVTSDDEKYLEYNEFLTFSSTDNGVGKSSKYLTNSKFKTSVIMANENGTLTHSIGTNTNADKCCLKREKLMNEPSSSRCTEDGNCLSRNCGTVIIKESYIEPPRINRISHSFHGKTLKNCTQEDILNKYRRASDNPLNYTSSVSQPSNLNNQSNEKIKFTRHKFLTQLSQPNDVTVCKKNKDDHRKSSLTNEAAKSMRFTTVKVDEATHALSVGNINKKVDNDTTSISKSCEEFPIVHQE